VSQGGGEELNVLNVMKLACSEYLARDAMKEETSQGQGMQRIKMVIEESAGREAIRRDRNPETG